MSDTIQIDQFKNIGVLGAGIMGAGIAQVFASKNYIVNLVDINEEGLRGALGAVDKSCARLVKKDKMTEQQKDQCLKNIKTSTSMEEFRECDLVVEAVTENKDLKLELFKALDGVCKDSALLATNTSSISVSLMAGVTSRPDKVMGMHFMNPVPLMKLVEGIKGLQTSEESFSQIKALSENLGKVFVESKDFPGFIVNRILMPMINEACFVLHEGIASAKDIDLSMTLGTHQPMGPLALADFIGLDTCLAIMRVLFEGLGEDKYRPSPLLVKYVEAGYLGKKSGKGFYEYKAL